MKVLLSSIGSRGDVQPILGLALALKALGHDARICAAPNFQSWVEAFGVEFRPIGQDLEAWTRAEAPKAKPEANEEQLRQFMRYYVAEQFRVTKEAAQGCDGILVGGVLQTAGRSVAEALDIPYVYAAYCPAVLPSHELPPAKMDKYYPQTLPAETNRSLWQEEEAGFNRIFREAIQEQRQALGLMPVESVHPHISTNQPWLASDLILGPAAVPMDEKMEIYQTGAWVLSESAPLPEELERFLDEGEPPLYFGFGSMRASEQSSRILIEAARALGYRAIISKGWGGLHLIDEGKDCIAIGSVNHEKLFPRVAVVAHHGGAGTTTAAAAAGKPQVIVPHHYDQFYWGHRAQVLGIGVSCFAIQELNVEGLVAALGESLRAETRDKAEAVASRIERNGALIAAERLGKMFA